jgi:hypothetical protein
MTRSKLCIAFFCTLLMYAFSNSKLRAQNTQIKGFVAATASVDGNGKVSFGFGEQDLFITSDLTEHISFLGETVFKYEPDSPTKFNVSVERIIVKYNFKGNHNFLIGKHHTPTHYWNDTYHHGRVFFPTVERPLMFAAQTMPIHTTGVSLRGLNLGNARFGYNLMIGNGIGSTEIADNDKYKSITAEVHIKPRDKMQIGVSYYRDVISAGAEDHHKRVFTEKINQHLYTATIAQFGQKFELLAEATLATNEAESTGLVKSFTSYAYAGVRLNDKLIPYLRYDYLKYDDKEIYYKKDDINSIVVGLRYEITFLVVVKMEYQHQNSELNGRSDILNTQIAIGF